MSASLPDTSKFEPSLELVGNIRKVAVETVDGSTTVTAEISSKDLESNSTEHSSSPSTKLNDAQEPQVLVSVSNTALPPIANVKSPRKANGRNRSKSASSLDHQSHRGSRIAPLTPSYSLSSEDYEQTQRNLNKSKFRLKCLAIMNGTMILMCALIFLYSSIFGSKTSNVMGRLQAQTTLLFVILMLVMVQTTITGKWHNIKSLQKYGGIVYTDDIGPVTIIGKDETQKA